jgi:thiamine pyrophosphokinase
MELAFLAARARGSTELVVVGGKGGRLDHLLVNAALIAACDWASVVWMTGSEIAYVVRRLLTIDGRAGDLLTLIAWGGDAHGVTTEGLRFPLSSETLAFGTARGLSNVMLEPRAKVSLSSGVVLAIHLPASDPLS